MRKLMADSECLKLETKLKSEESDEVFLLRFPNSRVTRRKKQFKHFEEFKGFKGRIQHEFNSSPMGPYEGPQVPLHAQLSKSKLDYDAYTSFSHTDIMQCKIFKIKKNYDAVDILKKIDTVEVDDVSEDMFIKPEDDQEIVYTCSKKFCRIPCLCNSCNTDKGQCQDHNMKHIDLFDDKEHAISVRTTEHSCTSASFFWCSYILKYPGIPKNCPHCSKDLLDHKSYHLDFHWNCKFCKLYQYKLFPKTVDELHKRELKEKKWYKSVCPYCDKKFSGIYQRQKHIDQEHFNKKLKCPKCPKSFQCKQSLDYHMLTKHTKKANVCYSCELCDKTFVAKVALENHLRFVHSDERKFSCDQCESKFKQKKHLHNHSLYVHGLNQKKEDYWQDLPKKDFECDLCKSKFIRKTDLKAHVKQKHENMDEFVCDQCSAKFKYKKNLTRHKIEKHAPEKSEFKCSHCSKIFGQKRSMEKHELCHVKE